MYPLVTDLADEEIPVAVTCRVLKFSTQGYYKWKAKPVYDRDLSDAYLINAAVDAHHDDPTFGYRFIADELETLGFEASENRVQRLCSLQRIWSVHAKKRGLNRRPGPPVHDDLVERDFTAPAANVLWLTDITEHRTGEGKLYLCAIKDAFSNRIVGYSMDARMPAALAVAALNNALMTRDVASTIVHSDRGSISRHRFREGPCPSRAPGINGPGGHVCRQCRHGIVLLAAAEERPRQRTMGNQGGTPSGHRFVDRADVQPSRASAHPREADTHRI